MLKRVYIDNYKCFVNFELRFEEITLLVGRNGAGKTAVFDAIYAVWRLLEGRSRITDPDVFPTSSLTRWQMLDVQTCEIDVDLEGDMLTYRIEIDHDREKRQARLRREVLSARGGPLFRFEFGSVKLYRDDHSEGPTFKGFQTESAISRVVSDLNNKRLCRFLEFMRTVLVCGLNPASFIAEASCEDQTLARDGSNFVNWYRHLMQERQDLAYEHIQFMREILDGLISFRLEKIGIDTRALAGMFGKRGHHYSLTFRELSEGERILTVLYALISLSDKPGLTLAIDGPANYVGLSEIQPWLIELGDACGTRVSQAILASQHPEVINYLGAGYAILLKRDGSGPTQVELLSERVAKLTSNGILSLSEVIARGWETE